MLLGVDGVGAVAVQVLGSAESGALAVLGVLGAARAGMEARVIEATRVVVAAVGEEVLALKGFTSVEELTTSQRVKWRAETKRAACLEIEEKLGVGVGEARHLVGLACAPVGVRALVLGAMDRGEIGWGRARAFWRRCARLPVAQAEAIAQGLFGDDPAAAVPERVDGEGELVVRPWREGDYVAALEREAVRAEGQDVIAERERRRRAYQERHAELVVADDGSAALTLVGSLVSLCAAHTRIDRAARLLRTQGDPRTLPQLHCDVAAALLIHGTLPHPDTTTGAGGATAPGHDGTSSGSEDPFGAGELAVADLESMARVLHALPPIDLQVIVPWDTLTGAPAGPAGPCGVPHGQGAPGGTPASEDTQAGAGAGVGLVVGDRPMYVSPGQVRELALIPGTTVHRLLTDPADGRLIERTRQQYRPDADMRAHVIAADVFSRAPGSRTPAGRCELDHVTPWGPQRGTTSASNLVALSKRAHQAKTLHLATATINQKRDLTWTTLLGQVHTTRSHDYRQHTRPAPDTAPPGPDTSDRIDPEVVGQDGLRRALDTIAPVNPAPDCHPSQRADIDHRRDTVARVLYAALAHRGPHALLTDDDDHPGSAEHGGHLGGWLFITHTTPGGTRRHGPPPETPTPADILHLTTPDKNTPPPQGHPPHDEPPPF